MTRLGNVWGHLQNRPMYQHELVPPHCGAQVTETMFMIYTHQFQAAAKAVAQRLKPRLGNVAVVWLYFWLGSVGSRFLAKLYQ